MEFIQSKNQKIVYLLTLRVMSTIVSSGSSQGGWVVLGNRRMPEHAVSGLVSGQKFRRYMCNIIDRNDSSQSECVVGFVIKKLNFDKVICANK